MTCYVVEVNEGIVDITRQGAAWWNLYRLRFRGTDRIRETKSPCIVGGLAEVACDSREEADWLAAHMVEHGGLPQSAVKVRKASTDA